MIQIPTELEEQEAKYKAELKMLRKAIRKLSTDINDMYGDAVKYPQLALPEYQLEQLTRLQTAASTMTKL